MMKGIYLLLGSNLGDKKETLEKATTLIHQAIGPVVKTSSVYETSAWGNTEQPIFYNQVIEVSSELPAEGILEQIENIELALGRIREEKWGARIIDIDILYYGDEVIATENLTVPHPGIPERRFTLVPLVDIAPAFTHPVLKKTHVQLLQDCPDPLEVKKLGL